MSNNGNFKIREPTPKLPPVLEVENILLKNYPNATPVSTNVASGIIYNDNGVLIYRANNNSTITVLGNS